MFLVAKSLVIGHVAALTQLVLAPLAWHQSNTELRYTARLELRSARTHEAGDAVYAFRQAVPGGVAVIRCVLREHEARMEFVDAGGGPAQGIVFLTLETGDLVQIDARHRTFWKFPAPSQPVELSGGVTRLEMTTEPTEDYALIAQTVHTRRYRTELRLSVSVPDILRSELPAALQRGSVLISADSWVATEQFQKYKVASGAHESIWKAFGLRVPPVPGVVLRQTVSAANYQTDFYVTDIAEGPASGGPFEPPAGFREVLAPFFARRP